MFQHVACFEEQNRAWMALRSIAVAKWFRRRKCPVHAMHQSAISSRNFLDNPWEVDHQKNETPKNHLPTFQHFKWFLLLTHPLSWKVAIKNHPKSSSSLGKFSQPHELFVAQNILDSTLIIIQQDSFSHWIASELSGSSPLAITKVNAKGMPRTTNMDQCQW